MNDFEFIVATDPDYKKALAMLNEDIRKKYSLKNVSIHSIVVSNQIVNIMPSVQYPNGGQIMVQNVTAVIVDNERQVSIPVGRSTLASESTTVL